MSLNPTVHLSPDELAEIDPLDYEERELSYGEHRNVLVLRSGMCLKNGILLKDSSYDIPRLYLRFLKKAYGSWLIRSTKRLDPDKRYLVVHNHWSGGYYHWITESLARLQPVMHLVDEATVLLPSNTKLDEVMVSSLACFGVGETEFFPPEDNVRVNHLILPQNPLRHREVPRASAEFVRRHVLAGIDTSHVPGERPRRVFISRARSRGRKIVNEEEVAEFLADRGYRRVFTEDMTFAEQVAMMQQAEVLVSQHGAGLTNLIFLPRGARVLELFRRPPGGGASSTVAERLGPTYPRLAAAVGMHYYCMLCSAADPRQSAWLGDIVVDIPSLEEKLRAVEAGH